MATVAEAKKRLGWNSKEHVAVAIWCEDDVIGLARQEGVQLGRKQAAEILETIDNNQDCEFGITWDTLRYFIGEFKDEHPHYRRYRGEEYLGND